MNPKDMKVVTEIQEKTRCLTGLCQTMLGAVTGAVSVQEAARQFQEKRELQKNPGTPETGSALKK